MLAFCSFLFVNVIRLWMKNSYFKSLQTVYSIHVDSKPENLHNLIYICRQSDIPLAPMQVKKCSEKIHIRFAIFVSFHISHLKYYDLTRSLGLFPFTTSFTLAITYSTNYIFVISYDICLVFKLFKSMITIRTK